jgi:hypothetical protein
MNISRFILILLLSAASIAHGQTLLHHTFAPGPLPNGKVTVDVTYANTQGDKSTACSAGDLGQQLSLKIEQ